MPTEPSYQTPSLEGLALGAQRVALDTARDPLQRLHQLREMRETVIDVFGEVDAVDVLGEVDTYIGDVALEVRLPERTQKLRDELVRRGMLKEAAQLEEAFLERLHPRDRHGRFRFRLTGPGFAPPFEPWPFQRPTPSPTFRPRPKPRTKREAWQERPGMLVVLRRDIEERVQALDYEQSLRLPEGTRVARLPAGEGFQIDGPTGKHKEVTLGGALAMAEGEENAARALRFGDTIPGNPMGPLAGVDTAPTDPVGDQIGGMLHGGWVTLPHGTLVHRAPGGQERGDSFEIIELSGEKRVFPATDKDATYAAARAAEDRAAKAPQHQTEQAQRHVRAAGGGPLAPLPPSFAETRRTLHRVSTQMVAPTIQPSWQIALVPTHGGFGTPWFRGAQGRTQVRVENNQLVRDAGGQVTRESIPGVDAQSASVLGTLYGLADSVIGQMKREHPDEKDDPRSKRTHSASLVWPEHFDIATEFGNDDHRANFGMSPGDEAHPEPYFYVGPWSAVRKGPVWNAAGFNGAELSYQDVLAAPDQRKAVYDFFSERLRALQGGEGLEEAPDARQAMSNQEDG